MSPLFPPPPRGTRAPAERGSPGAACQLPSRPTLPWARPRSLAGGQHPHYRCQARELEQRAGGAGPGHRWGGVPPGVSGQGDWEGSVPELAGAVEFSRVSDGRSDPRQPPRACWTTGSWSSPALAHGHTRWPHSAQPGPHLAKLLSTVPDPSPLPRRCPALAVLEGSRLYSVLGLRVPVSPITQRRSGTRCPPTLCSRGRPLAWDVSVSRPSTGEEPMGVAPGREQREGEEMGTQGTLHPRKHPSSSAGVVPEHRHKQTDSNTHRQIQTHTETHTPNGRFPSPGAPTTHPAQLPCLLVEAILALPLPSLEHGQCHPTHPRSIEGMSSRMWPALSRVTAPFLKKGAMKGLKGAFLERPEGRQGSLDQLRRGGVLRKGGLKGSAPARLRSCWHRFSGLLPPPRGWLCSRAGW